MAVLGHGLASKTVRSSAPGKQRKMSRRSDDVLGNLPTASCSELVLAFGWLLTNPLRPARKNVPQCRWRWTTWEKSSKVNYFVYFCCALCMQPATNGTNGRVVFYLLLRISGQYCTRLLAGDHQPRRWHLFRAAILLPCMCVGFRSLALLCSPSEHPDGVDTLYNTHNTVHRLVVHFENNSSCHTVISLNSRSSGVRVEALVFLTFMVRFVEIIDEVITTCW